MRPPPARQYVIFHGKCDAYGASGALHVASMQCTVVAPGMIKAAQENFNDNFEEPERIAEQVREKVASAQAQRERVVQQREQDWTLTLTLTLTPSITLTQ